ncbi:MAG: DUF2142 domain-containing protein [Acidimicrobiales bacterium]
MDRTDRLNPRLRLGLATALATLAVLTCWACLTGRYGGPDEPAHVLRAHAVAHGELLGDPVPSLPPGYRSVRVPSSLGTGDPSCYRHDPRVPSDCADASAGDDVTVASSAGVNPPWYYALVGIPARLLGGRDDPLAYRLAALAWVALATGVLAVRVRHRPAARLLVALAPPSCWFLWGVVNPNGLEVVLVALAATAAVAGDTGAPARREVWWAAVPLALAISMRPVAALWALAVLAVFELEWQRSRAIGRRERLVLWGVPALGVATVLVWNAWAGLVVDDERTAGSRSVWAALRHSVRGLPRSGNELIASLGWLEYHAPWVAVVAWVVAVGVMLLTRPHVRRATWVVLGGALVVVPVVFEVALDHRVGPIWQGRYSLPVAAAIAVVGTCRATRPPSRRVQTSVLIASAVAMVSTAWVAARRYAVGTDGSWWFDGAVASSRGPGAGTWVVLLAVFTAALMGVLAPRRISSSEPAARHASDPSASIPPR